MDFGKGRESTNFTDHSLGDWVKTPQGKSLLSSLLLQQDVSGGPSDGYSKWLQDSLKNLSPQDLYLMKSNGLTIEDVARLHAMQNGTFPIHQEAYPYKDQ